MELLICCNERTQPTNVRHDPQMSAAVVWNALCGSDYVLHMYVGLYGYVLYDTMQYWRGGMYGQYGMEDVCTVSRPYVRLSACIVVSYMYITLPYGRMVCTFILNRSCVSKQTAGRVQNNHVWYEYPFKSKTSPRSTYRPIDLSTALMQVSFTSAQTPRALDQRNAVKGPGGGRGRC
jgi:hypothetical protein